MGELFFGKGLRETLQVSMFGGFSITYAGKKMGFSRSSNTKFIQLLQLLFLHYGNGITKKELIDALYGWEAGVNPNKNLNSVIYRLKKQLILAGLPEENYVRLENGMCRWSSSFPVETDAVLFEDYMERAAGAAEDVRIRLLRQAEQLYTGEFLPEFSTELWVIERSLQYKKLYETAVRDVGKYLNQSGNYRDELKLYRKAGKIYPYDKWQVHEIDCLMLLKEYKEAYEVYQYSAKLYCEEMGVPPGPEMINRLRQIERQIKSPVGSFEDLRENFREKQNRGAYYCLYPSFLDSCQLLARVAERNGRSIFLMLMNLTDKMGKEITDMRKLEVQMALLKEVIKSTLRRGDIFTTYSKSQFMIILVGTKQENCNKAFTRCLERWKKTEGARGELSYSVESLVKLLSPEAAEREEDSSWDGKQFLNTLR